MVWNSFHACFYLNPTLIKFFVSNFFVFWVLSWQLIAQTFLFHQLLELKNSAKKCNFIKVVLFQQHLSSSKSQGFLLKILESMNLIYQGRWTFFVHFAPSLPNAHFRNKSQQKTFFKNFLWRKYVTNIGTKILFHIF